jgi:hypothetical protein
MHGQQNIKKYRITLAAIYENRVQYFHKWTKDGTTEEIGCSM